MQLTSLQSLYDTENAHERLFTVHALTTQKRSCSLSSRSSLLLSSHPFLGLPSHLFPLVFWPKTYVKSYYVYSNRFTAVTQQGANFSVMQWREELRKPLWCAALCNSRQTAFLQIDQPKCGYSDEFSNLLSQARNSQHTCLLLNE